MRASLSILKRLSGKIILPLFDASLLYVGFYFIKSYWQQTWLAPNGGSYPLVYMLYFVPSYILILLGGVLLTGGYDKPYQIPKLIKGLFMGIISILVMYALLPESFRYSRAIIIAGTFWGFLSLSLYRYIFQLLNIKSFGNKEEQNNRILIVGSDEESERVASLLRNMAIKPAFIGLISLKEESEKHKGFIGSLHQLQEIINVYSIGEVVFCAKDLSAQSIIDQMIQLQKVGVDYKIAPEESIAIIGSNSINASEDLFMIDVDSISKPQNKRNKRLLDIILSFIFLITLAVNIWFVKNNVKYLANIFRVLFSKYTWVGYYIGDQQELVQLPNLKKGILHPGNAFTKQNLSNDTLSRLNTPLFPKL